MFTSQAEDPKDEPWFGVKVNAVVQVGLQYMHWSDASITWGREDHPPLMPRPGGYALVLDSIVFSETHTCRFCACSSMEAAASTCFIILRWRSSGS
jgi:hypothetical protein